MSSLDTKDSSNEDNSSKEIQEIQETKENNESDKDEYQDTNLQQEKRRYINFIFCQISIGIISTYLYIFMSICMNMINRILFHTYKFRFNFTILFCQQFFCLVTFVILSYTSETYRNKAGELSYNDYKSFRKKYISFAFVFILNNLIGFIGSQLIVNTPMFLTLRKLVLVMIYLNDVFIGKKKLSCFTSTCVLIVTFGTVLAGIEDFSADYVGYIIVIIYNALTVLYNKMTETFKRDTGVPNLKLLVYNSFLSCPFLFILIFATGEYKKLIIYLTGEKIFEGSYVDAFVYLFFFCAFCVALILSFFISNEKNSSLFTAMLSNSKDVIITGLSYFWLKGTKFTFCIIGGLLISTVGAVLIAVKSMYDNLRKKKRDEEVRIRESENRNLNN
jgi:drug/metabolite transporter (DMT)-like permease